MSARRFERLALAGIVLAAFALRVYHLDAMSFWSDEGISVLRAQLDIPALLANLPAEHVPLYFVSLHYWMGVAGEGDFAVRFFSLWFSVLAVPLAYRLGLAATGQRAVAWLAALLLAVNPLQIWYAQEARMYSLLVALVAGAAWALLAAVASRRSRRSWIAFALLMAAGLYTHFFAALALAALGLWSALVWWRDRRSWRVFGVGYGLLGVLCLPWLPRALGALSFPGWQEAADPLSLPWRYLVAYSVGSTIGEPWQWLALGFLVLLAVGAFVLARVRSLPAWLPLAGVAVPFVLMMALALRKPGYHERYLIVVTPFFALLLAAALAGLWRGAARWRRPVAVLALIGMLCGSALSLARIYADPLVAKPDFRSAAQYIDRLSRDGDGLIFDGPDPNKAFYRYFSQQKVTAFDEGQFDPQDIAEATAFLMRETPKRDRWWVVLYFHPPGPTEDWLAANGFQTSSRWFNGIRVLLFATPTEASLRAAAPASVQTALPLTLTVRMSAAVYAGDVLPVILRWQATATLPADYQASVRLIGADGRVIRQLDRRPLDGRVPTSQWRPDDVLDDRYGLLVPEDTPSGDYTVQVILYPLNGAPAWHSEGPMVRVLPPP
ncbi:MAG: glycosyltransferase family 39 protein [Chloroflexi bacterium]|nr:glycosyltransferase family 39 protein [Chloroflexota bacterium]